VAQWEYCYVSHRGNEAGYLAHYTAHGIALRPILPDLQGGPPTELQEGTATRARAIWQLGQEGWELVTVLRVEGDHLPPGATWYFKRPKP
jgi:hypothetical protein